MAPSNSPPKPLQTYNFLLRLTLVKTTNPTVTRLLTVPSTLTFAELHSSIAASFGWDANSDPCNSWLFRLWGEDPVKFCDQSKYKGATAVYCTTPESGLNILPGNMKTETTVGSLFHKEGSGRYWTYDYSVSRFHHAIEVVDMTFDDKKSKISCLGGQGSISRKAWQFADMTNVDGVSIGAKSSWDMDMGELNAKLSVVQKSFEMRKEREAATKAKTPAVPKKAPIAKKAGNGVPNGGVVKKPGRKPGNTKQTSARATARPRAQARGVGKRTRPGGIAPVMPTATTTPGNTTDQAQATDASTASTAHTQIDTAAASSTPTPVVPRQATSWLNNAAVPQPSLFNLVLGSAPITAPTPTQAQSSTLRFAPTQIPANPQPATADRTATTPPPTSLPPPRSSPRKLTRPPSISWGSPNIAHIPGLSDESSDDEVPVLTRMKKKLKVKMESDDEDGDGEYKPSRFR